MVSLYDKSQRMMYDKQQTVLTPNTLFGVSPNFRSFAEKHLSYTIFDERKIFCPFCLGQYQINAFLISTKKGTINKLLGLCPDCKNEMQLKTLDSLVKMTMKEFARWCFEYRLSGFWGKVTRGFSGSEGDVYFKEFNRRLKHFENYEDFWLTYKNLKGYDDKDNNGENEE
jgi:hypothetical protein